MQFENVVAAHRMAKDNEGSQIMVRKLAELTFSITVLVASIAAQTVTGSGTTNTVPVFTGSSTVGNSPISVAGSSVGIGTTLPQSALDVSGNVNYTTITAGAGQYTNGTNSGYYYVGSLPNGGWSVVQHLEVEVLGGAWNAQGLTRWTCNAYGNAVRCTRLNDSYSPNINDIVAFLDSSGQYNFYVSASVIGAWQSFAVGAKLWDGTHYRTVNSIYVASPSGTQQTIALTVGPTLTQSGNVGIGTTSPGYRLDVVGQIHTSNGVVYADGTQQTTAWTGVLCGGDYAESVDVIGGRADYGPGDVLVIDPNDSGKFLKSSESYSTAVLGIYSTKPGAVGRRQAVPKSNEEVPMAMIGIVPTKVSAENGPIKPGDLLVTSSIPGYAMKGTDRSRMLGAVIGKAMGHLNSGTGVIEVGVTLQ